VSGRFRVKRVYEPVSSGDGQRVLVDRIWPRGISKHTASLSLWLKEVAPSADLRKWFGHDASRWDEFRRRYRIELAGNEETVARLRGLAGSEPVTLLYGASDTLHNNAVALADYLRETGADERGQ